jgi:hypothetical protein
MTLKNPPKEEYCFAAICSRNGELKIIGHIRKGGEQAFTKKSVKIFEFLY